MATNIEEQSINNNADQLFQINHVNFNSFDSELYNGICINMAPGSSTLFNSQASRQSWAAHNF